MGTIACQLHQYMAVMLGENLAFLPPSHPLHGTYWYTLVFRTTNHFFCVLGCLLDFRSIFNKLNQIVYSLKYFWDPSLKSWCTPQSALFTCTSNTITSLFFYSLTFLTLHPSPSIMCELLIELLVYLSITSSFFSSLGSFLHHSFTRPSRCIYIHTSNHSFCLAL